MNKKEHFPRFLGVFLDYYLKCGYKVDTAIKMAVAKTKKLMLVIDEASKRRRISEIKEQMSIYEKHITHSPCGPVERS